jgi:hypothetical protein
MSAPKLACPTATCRRPCPGDFACRVEHRGSSLPTLDGKFHPSPARRCGRRGDHLWNDIGGTSSEGPHGRLSPTHHQAYRNRWRRSNWTCRLRNTILNTEGGFIHPVKATSADHVENRSFPERLGRVLKIPS